MYFLAACCDGNRPDVHVFSCLCCQQSVKLKPDFPVEYLSAVLVPIVSRRRRCKEAESETVRERDGTLREEEGRKTNDGTGSRNWVKALP